MKSRLLTTAAFLASLAAAPVMAQPDQQHGDHGGGPQSGEPHGGGGAHEGGGTRGPAGAPHQGGGGAQHGGPGGGAPHPAAATPAAPVHTEAHPAAVSPGGRNDQQRGGRDDHQGRTETRPAAGRDAHQDRNGPDRGGADRNGPNRNGPGRGPSNNQPFARGSATAHGGHFNFQGRNVNRAHAPAFRYPHGYGYRRWGVGSRLPRLFLGSSYFFTDYATFGFGPPPYGEQWVRYGPDLLLVDIDTGEVTYVIYGAFY